MKKTSGIIIILLLLSFSNAFAQIADGISYQAVALDEKGKEIAGHDINGSIIHSSQIRVRFSIIRGTPDGTLLYSEEHSTYTDQYGLFSLVIGHGESSSDGLYQKLTDIKWAEDKLFLKVEIDIKSKGYFKLMGIQQMMAVPFAFHALTSSSSSTVNYSDILNKPDFSVAAISGSYNDLLDRPDLFNGDYNSLINAPLIPTTTSDLINDAGYITSYTEADPIWTEASANYFTRTNMQTSGESQLHFDNITGRPTTLSGYGITDAFSGTWANLTGKPTTIAGYGITDAMSNTSPSNGITNANISNWNTAFSWGSHVGHYRPITYVPGWSEITSNPFLFTSPANNQLIRYNSVTGRWINWTPNFLTSYTETDPIWNGASANYYTKTNMQTNGSAQLHFNNITNRPTTLAGYGITDGLNIASPAGGISNADISNWNMAFFWGNHAVAGYQTLVNPGTVTQYWRGDKTWQILDNVAVGLSNVENIGLSTWAGSTAITTVGSVLTGIWNAGEINTPSTVTASAFIKSGGTSSQFLKADGSIDGNTYLIAIREITDEFTASAGQTSFTLSQVPDPSSRVKMYINGIRISNLAYSHTGVTLTYSSSSNGSYDMKDGDRVQFDYTY